MTEQTAEQKTEFRPRDRWLNFALVLGPTAWMLHLGISYMLVSESCEHGTKLMLHGVTAACVALALIAAAIAWKIRAACLDDPAPALWKDRTRWLATMIVCLSLAMTLVILAQQIPNLLLRSCD